MGEKILRQQITSHRERKKLKKKMEGIDYADKTNVVQNFWWTKITQTTNQESQGEKRNEDKNGGH